MKLLSRCTLILSLTVICASIVQGAVVGVAIRDNIFDPINIVIRPGDGIIWTNFGPSLHDSSSATNLWRSFDIARSNTYSFTFTNLGYYPYRCNRHVLQQQTGTVSVISISLANALRTPTNAQFEIRGGRSGLRAVVEAGNTLGSATPLRTNTFPANGTINFADTNPPPTFRFYRARVIP